MNFIIVICLMACAIGCMADDKELTAEHMKKAEQYSKECSEETGVDLKAFEGVKMGELADPKLFEDKKFRCFSKCFILKCGLINEAGEPQLDKIKEVMHLKDDSPMIDDIKTCTKEITDEDVCDKAYKLQKCMQDKQH